MLQELERRNRPCTDAHSFVTKRRSVIQSRVATSRLLNGRLFPTRGDYERYFIEQELVAEGDRLWRTPRYLPDVQMHWHTTGQNGCVFAQVIARSAPEIAWQHVVFPGRNVEAARFTNLQSIIRQSIDDADCQILSLLFPDIVDVNDLVTLIATLLTVPGMFLEEERICNDLVTLALRMPVTLSGALAWLMGFGPFDCFPETRQAPMTEVAIRVKQKPEMLFHRLNADPETAHLADFPMGLPEGAMEKLWNATLKNTRAVLGREPDDVSAARVTFAVPMHAWSASVQDDRK